MRPLIVGETNPYSANPRYALYPDPPGCAGYRLCASVLGMAQRDYLAAFDRENLLRGPRWSRADAVSAAARILDARRGGALLLLGSRVSEAFGLDFLRDFEAAPAWTGLLALRLPHPSGRCRVWNDPSSRGRARDALRAFLAPELASLVGSALDGD